MRQNYPRDCWCRWQNLIGRFNHIRHRPFPNIVSGLFQGSLMIFWNHGLVAGIVDLVDWLLWHWPIMKSVGLKLCFHMLSLCTKTSNSIPHPGRRPHRGQVRGRIVLIVGVIETHPEAFRTLFISPTTPVPSERKAVISFTFKLMGRSRRWLFTARFLNDKATNWDILSSFPAEVVTTGEELQIKQRP